MSILNQKAIIPSPQKFVVVSPPYHPSNGGATVLYYLCKLLNDQGHEAKLFLWFHIDDDTVNTVFILRMFKYYTIRMIVLFVDFLSYRKNIVKSYKLVGYKKSPIKVSIKLTPFINKHTIVIYPEVINGNPLNSSNVVRWLLHKPGFHTGSFNFSKNELFFCYSEIFNDESLNPDKNKLTIPYIKHSIYKQTNFKVRKGKCYIVRKGRKRFDLPGIFDGPVIDTLQDKEIADIFNQCEYCVSYDKDTLYTYYAVMCGCIPIIVPIKGKEREEDLPRIHGHARGFDPDEIEFAIKTRGILKMQLKEMEAENTEQVQKFVFICMKTFFI